MPGHFELLKIQEKPFNNINSYFVGNISSCLYDDSNPEILELQHIGKSQTIGLIGSKGYEISKEQVHPVILYESVSTKRRKH